VLFWTAFATGGHRIPVTLYVLIGLIEDKLFAVKRNLKKYVYPMDTVFLKSKNWGFLLHELEESIFVTQFSSHKALQKMCRGFEE
jgi:hypothetical protein